MPSPFPGMDPFLENPEIFPDLHDTMVAYVREALHKQLGAPYYVSLKARVWMESSVSVKEPDVRVLRSRQKSPGRQSRSSVALAAKPSRPIVVNVEREERKETYLEMFKKTNGGSQLVTSIEVLSPTNKTLRNEGRKLYLAKQREVLDSRVNLVEIDLLRGGKHATAVPRALAIDLAGLFDYHVCIHQYYKPSKYFVYPISIFDPLPVIEIPLLKGEGEVPIDLQAVFERCYDVGSYEMWAGYQKNQLVPPLPPEKADWATARLRERGILSA
jgi:hypothetical protein